MNPAPPWTTALALLTAVAAVAWAEPERAKDSKPTTDQVAFFETKVRPLLQAQCVNCHGGEAKIKGGLKLTSRADVLKGGSSGPAVDLARPDESLLLQAVNYEDSLQMPPKGKLPQAQIDVFKKWVAMGLPWGEESSAARHGPPQVDARAKSFWAFRPLTHPAVPAVKDAAWVRNPVDHFILAKLEAAGLRPVPPAEKGALLRRVYYDLIGLPPTPEEVAAFLADTSPTAYEQVVDRLLASPHYGERWARHWLDLVRYAESNSFERDGAKPFVWRYRDYVIRSFNADKPYDVFLREQLAGDELLEARGAERGARCAERGAIPTGPRSALRAPRWRTPIPWWPPAITGSAPGMTSRSIRSRRAMTTSTTSWRRRGRCSSG